MTLVYLNVITGHKHRDSVDSITLHDHRGCHEMAYILKNTHKGRNHLISICET